MKFTIGKKLGLAFGTLLGLMIISLGFVYWKSAEIRAVEEGITGLRMPTMMAVFKLQRDLNQTMSKGRQAVLAGTESARRDDARKLFESAWADVNKDAAAIDGLAPNWTLSENRDRWVRA